MNKLTLVILIFLTAAAATVTFVWYFSVALDPSIPSSAVVPSLSETVQIDWYDYGAAISYTSTDLDAHRASGFVHGIRYPWMLNLMRRTAAGKLGSWFDADLGSIDSLVKILDIEGAALRTFRDLDPRTRAILEAYADGVNTAFGEGRAYRDESLLAIDRVPDPWEPWHSVAIDRLLAWITASEELERSDSTGGVPLLKASRKLREWLQIGGFTHSVAWFVQETDSSAIGVRLVTGASTIPILLPLALTNDGGDTLHVLNLLGTPFRVFSSSNREATISLLSSSAVIRSASADSGSVNRTFSRIVNFDGDEHLLSRWTIRGNQVVQCRDSHLNSGNGITPGDTCTVLVWPELNRSADASEWFSSASTEEHQVWKPIEVRVDSSGRISSNLPREWSSVREKRIAVSGHSPWVSDLQTRLGEIVSATDWSSEEITRDARSAWARPVAERLLSSLAPADTSDERLASAVSYLRNWDYTYNRTSIAASILEEWIQYSSISESRGPWEPGLSGELAARRRADFGAFLKALDSLEAQLGPDMSEWRWESYNRPSFKHPGWTFLKRVSNQSSYRNIISRKTAVVHPTDGHPTTFRWSSSSLTGSISIPSATTLTMSTREWNTPVLTFSDVQDESGESSLPTTGNGFSSINLADRATRATTRLTPPEHN